jgi:hypothetical protein
MAEEERSRGLNLDPDLFADTVNCRPCLLLGGNAFDLACPAVALAPFAGFTPDIATFDLDNQHSLRWVEEHEIALALGTHLGRDASQRSRVKPPEGVNDSDFFGKPAQGVEDTLLAMASVEVSYCRRNHSGHRLKIPVSDTAHKLFCTKRSELRPCGARASAAVVVVTFADFLDILPAVAVPALAGELNGMNTLREDGSF